MSEEEDTAAVTLQTLKQTESMNARYWPTVSNVKQQKKHNTRLWD